MAQRAVDDAGVCLSNAAQVARGQHQRPVVGVRAFLQRQHFHLARLAEMGGGFADGILVGVAYRGGGDGAQEGFALVEEVLRFVGRGIHVAPVVGHHVAERPIQVKGSAGRDADEQGHCKKVQQQGGGARRGLGF
ncbi:hypothetical protein D3C77_591840 [compost metagenome]